MRRFLFILCSVFLLAGPAGAMAEGADKYGDRLGTVQFEVSCSPSVQGPMERGLALLHHMTYSGARDTFERVIASDPDCSLAYWGVAMTYVHPLWLDPPDDEEIARAEELLTLARSRGEKTEREHAYIAALEAYYRDARGRDESARLVSFDAAWEDVHRAFPDDVEAAALHALAHMATASAADKSYQKQKEAGAILEEILRRVPDHPGAHHYLIHAYDFPGLASEALTVARNYGKVAPEVPHALHMPSHIFTRLGLWPESVAWNERSAKAAWENRIEGAITLHYPHALDYLAYAYLQQAQDGEAKKIVEKTQSITVSFHELNARASAYALAAIPARYALERRQWAEAAKLEPREPASFPWGDRFAAFEAISHFARALGAARSGDSVGARRALAALQATQDLVAGTGAYWRSQVAIQQVSARAWLALAEGRQAEALDLMHEAAAMAAVTEKHPVTPGEILPTQELLGDMLLEIGRPVPALTAYQAELERSPNRFNSLYGAGRAAELSGDRGQALQYYGRLTEVAGNADTERPRLQHARSYVASTR